MRTGLMSIRNSGPPAGKPAPKPWIEGIHAYVPGKSSGSGGQALVKLSANENPLGTSQGALDARASIGHAAPYPDPSANELREAIGSLHGIDPARIVCGTGSDELLNLAAQGFAGRDATGIDEVLFSRFSFVVYDIAARRCGANTIEAADNDYGSDVNALLAAVTERTRVVFVANPNNPTGTYLPADELARLHSGLRSDVLLVVDQAYAEYLSPDEDDGGLSLALAHNNVLVTRTFSKIYGLAGERIGWATGAPDLIDVLNRIRGPFNVTNSGQAAAIAAIKDQAFVEKSRQHNARELARFNTVIESLGNYGLRAIPSKANFALVVFEGAVSAEQGLNAIAKAGYAVRHLPGQGLGHALRITIGTATDMNVIADTLRNLVEAS